MRAAERACARITLQTRSASPPGPLQHLSCARAALEATAKRGELCGSNCSLGDREEQHRRQPTRSTRPVVAPSTLTASTETLNRCPTLRAPLQPRSSARAASPRRWRRGGRAHLGIVVHEVELDGVAVDRLGGEARGDPAELLVGEEAAGVGEVGVESHGRTRREWGVARPARRGGVVACRHSQETSAAVWRPATRGATVRGQPRLAGGGGATTTRFAPSPSRLRGASAGVPGRLVAHPH